MNVLKKKPTIAEDVKTISESGIHGKRNYALVLVYRWLLFLFSAVLCVTGDRFEAMGHAILETLAVTAVYNFAATMYIINSERKYSRFIAYIDMLAIMLLVLFSGGIRSDLYIFPLFLVGLCGICENFANIMKTGILCAILYAATCVLSDALYKDGLKYPALAVRGIMIVMAAFAMSRISFEVKKYDEMRKREFRLARTDRLTGLANRHYFDQKVREEVEYAKISGSVINVLLFDIDNFKAFNDTYGHLSGDKLLMLFADIIRQCVRKSDIPVRYGGEEFMILIRDMDMIIAKSVGDRIRKQLEKQRIYVGQDGERQKVTVSCGVAQFPTHSASMKDVIEKADRALYHAKEIGKNIVVCYDEIGLARDEIEVHL